MRQQARTRRSSIATSSPGIIGSAPWRSCQCQTMILARCRSTTRRRAASPHRQTSCSVWRRRFQSFSRSRCPSAGCRSSSLARPSRLRRVHRLRAPRPPADPNRVLPLHLGRGVSSTEDYASIVVVLHAVGRAVAERERHGGAAADRIRSHRPRVAREPAGPRDPRASGPRSRRHSGCWAHREPDRHGQSGSRQRRPRKGGASLENLAPPNGTRAGRRCEMPNARRVTPASRFGWRSPRRRPPTRDTRPSRPTPISQ
jgi:hypothetical protein